MSFNGSGTYQLPVTTVTPAVSSTTISSSDQNTFTADLATALTLCICKDGQSTISANLPMSTFKHTGVGVAAALTEYASADDVIDNTLLYGGASAAGTDTYAVNLAISPGAYKTGQVYYYIADVVNTGACTINYNSIGAKSIKMLDGTDPHNGAIQAGPVATMYDGTNMVLLNPSLIIGTDVQAYDANLVTASSTATFTNKTFDANGTGNSLSNVDVADLANGTDGELITWDAAGAPAVVAVGTATHVLTSNGVGAPPTFQASSGISQAVQADIEAETNEDTYIPPDLLKHNPGVAKAWINFDGTGAGSTGRARHNMDAFTDNGTGDYTVNFTTNFSSANYAYSVTAGSSLFIIGAPSAAPAAGSFRFVMTDQNGTAADAPYVSAVFYGDQ